LSPGIGATRYKASRLLRSRVRNPPVALMFVWCECCMVSGKDVCDEPITRAEEFYQLWRVVVRDLETSEMKRPWTALGCSATGKRKKKVVAVPIVPIVMAVFFLRRNHPTSRKFWGIFFVFSRNSRTNSFNWSHIFTVRERNFIPFNTTFVYLLQFGFIKIWNLARGFDCVNHEILLAKLHFHGIGGVSEDWFKFYLTNRRQRA